MFGHQHAGGVVIMGGLSWLGADDAGRAVLSFRSKFVLEPHLFLMLGLASPGPLELVNGML